MYDIHVVSTQSMKNEMKKDRGRHVFELEHRFFVLLYVLFFKVVVFVGERMRKTFFWVDYKRMTLNVCTCTLQSLRTINSRGIRGCLCEEKKR